MKKIIPFLLILLTGCTPLQNKTLINRIQWIANRSNVSGACVRYEHSQVIYFDPAYLLAYPQEKDADIICISHPHFDHCDAEAVLALLKDNGIVITNQEVFDAIGEDVGPEKFIIVAPGDETEINGILVEAVPSYENGSFVHGASFGYTGFIITDGKEKIYFSGDAGDMAEFSDFPELDAALVCVRISSPYLMLNYMEKFCEEVGPELLIPVHWPTGYAETEIREKAVNLPEQTELVLLPQVTEY